MSDELKPCPFCGGKAQLEGDYEANWVCVECPECKIRTAHQTKEEAIEAWNRRVTNE